MIATLDTNVLVSAAAFDGVPRAIILGAASGRFEMALSPAILEEYREVMTRSDFGVDDARADVLVTKVRDVSTVVYPTRRVTVIHEDPDDNAILECAIEAHANCIVSGDRHLLKLSEFEGMPIVQPREFLDLLDSGQDLEAT